MKSENLHFLVTKAISFSQKSYMAFKHSAIIIRQGKIISYGINTEKEHAEINAINNLQRLLFSQETKERKERKERY